MLSGVGELKLAGMRTGPRIGDLRDPIERTLVAAGRIRERITLTEVPDHRECLACIGVRDRVTRCVQSTDRALSVRAAIDNNGYFLPHRTIVAHGPLMHQPC